jgi:hypothetical protein
MRNKIMGECKKQLNNNKLDYFQMNNIIEGRIEQDFTYLCYNYSQCCEYKNLMRIVNKKLDNRKHGHSCHH